MSISLSQRILSRSNDDDRGAYQTKIKKATHRSGKHADSWDGEGYLLKNKNSHQDS